MPVKALPPLSGPTPGANQNLSAREIGRSFSGDDDGGNEHREGAVTQRGAIKHHLGGRRWA